MNRLLPTLNLRFARPAFTLVELLIIVAITGIMVSLVYVNFGATRDRGRDTRRKQDLKAVSAALVSYYQDFGAYPPPCNPSPCASRAQYPSDAGDDWIPELVPDYIAKLPKDPGQTGFKLPGSVFAQQALSCADKIGVYCYEVLADRASFTLWAQLQNSNDSELRTKPDAPCYRPSLLAPFVQFNFCIKSPQ